MSRTNQDLYHQQNYIQKKFSCFLIGEGTLPIQCASLLLEGGHQIFGIISPDALISDWAKAKGIPHIQPTDNLIAFLSQKPFDYLFSIVNSSLLPKEILELPSKYAINYHDAPLPKYAGVNATSWALLHQEKTHGVTWHVMTNVVDGGDILKQPLLDIADDETAFTLNGKCYEAAIHSFAQLIDELSSHQVLARKQNLGERTYFSRYRRSSVEGVSSFTGGVFSFNRCAREIDALVRALDFGPYPNSLALPKLAIGSNFIVVSKLEVLKDLSEALPGTVTAIEDSFLKVSTTSYDIALRQVLTINGQTLSIPDLVAKFGLKVGYQLKSIQPEIAERIEAFDALIAKHEAFWVKKLATLKPYTIPYAVRTASHSKQKQYKRVLMSVPQEVITFLERHSVWKGSDFLLTAFAAYLARIGGTNCFDIGFKDIERQRELVGLESFFAEHVPFRVEVDSKLSFEEVFETLREPLKLSKRRLTFTRDIVARYPVLNKEPDLLSENKFPVTIERVERLDEQNVCSGNELTLVIPSDGKQCCWLYNTLVLDSDSIALMLRSFTSFLQSIVTNTTQSITNLALLSESERHRILVEWNNQKVDLPTDACIHQLFEAQVERTPNAPAMMFEDEQSSVEQQLTYRQLNSRANQLAHYLQALGVGPNVLVGICMERSLEMVVGLLGILKAGGAYVPLDPAHPQERLTLVLSDIQTPVMLTQEKLVKNLPDCGTKHICLDSDWELIAQNSQENPVNEATVDNLIYVIYTSGSTGKPKGVMISHRGICNQLHWRQTTFRLTERDKVLQTIPLSFDPSVWQIFWPLSFGGQLVMARPGGHQDTAYLVKVIAEQQITVAALVPSLIRVLLEEKGIENCKSLRHVTSGGEALSVELMERFFERLNLDNILLNCYGPTEAAIDATAWICQRGTHYTTAPIGRPITNVQTYILDENLQPVPVGHAGELYIGGLGLAQGYFNRPELTADKFIPNPFYNSKLYKTGDLARYLPDGNIEFLGRIDHQVKIRGFRIELGEIEATLGQHRAVQETLVTVTEDIPGDKRLVAYLVARPEQVPPGASELRSFLQDKLPEYMVPAAFVFMDAMPLNANGKVDRRALPAPDISHFSDVNSFVAPRTPTEKVIADIWAQVLDLDQVGVHNNFFHLGGHSLLAVKVFAQIEKTFGKKLPLAILFQSNTVEALAKILSPEEIGDRVVTMPHREDNTANSWSCLVAIQPKGDKHPLFCIHPLGGEVLCYRPLAMHLGNDQPFYGIQPLGLDGKPPLTRIEDMAALYIQEIQTIQPNGPYFLGGFSMGGVIGREMAMQLSTQGHQVGLLAIFDSGLPGFSKRVPFIQRAFIHASNLIQRGPTYLKKKLLGWREWGQYHIRKRYMNLLGISEALPEGDHHITVMDANVQALNAYTFVPYSGQITLFRTEDDSEDTQDHAVGIKSEPLLGWDNVVTGGIDVHYIPGSHITLFDEPHVQELADKLKYCLEKAQTYALTKR